MPPEARYFSLDPHFVFFSVPLDHNIYLPSSGNINNIPPQAIMPRRLLKHLHIFHSPQPGAKVSEISL